MCDIHKIVRAYISTLSWRFICLMFVTSMFIIGCVMMYVYKIIDIGTLSIAIGTSCLCNVLACLSKKQAQTNRNNNTILPQQIATATTTITSSVSSLHQNKIEQKHCDIDIDDHETTSDCAICIGKERHDDYVIVVQP